MLTSEKETSKNVFQRLGGDSERKGLYKVFRNYEVSEEAEDKEAKMQRWVEVKPSQPSYHGSARKGWRKNTKIPISLVTKKDLARFDCKWYIVGKI